MIDPVWFFSTLAQATAASIGFVIAFSAALYSSRRSSRQERINRFKDDMRQYREEVEDVTEEMAQTLQQRGSFKRNREIYQQETSSVDITSEIREWANNQPEPQVALIWANISWFRSVLQRLREDVDPANMESDFKELEYPIVNLLTNFNVYPSTHVADPPPWERFYDEITQTDETAPDDYSSDYSIFEIQDNMELFLANTVMGGDSRNIEGWKNAILGISDSYYTIDARKYFDTDLFDNNLVGPVLNRCKVLFFIGVILPSSLLMTIPDTLLVEVPILTITIIQASILVIIMYLSWALFSDLIYLVSDSRF